MANFQLPTGGLAVLGGRFGTRPLGGGGGYHTTSRSMWQPRNMWLPDAPKKANSNQEDPTISAPMMAPLVMGSLHFPVCSFNSSRFANSEGIP